MDMNHIMILCGLNIGCKYLVNKTPHNITEVFLFQLVQLETTYIEDLYSSYVDELIVVFSYCKSAMSSYCKCALSL